MRSKVLIGIGVVLGLGILIVRTKVPAHLVIGALLVGWIAFLARVLPEVSIAWDGVATGLVCLVLFAFGLHGFMGWLSRGIDREANPANPGRRWKPGWTVSIVAVVVLMFAAGIGAAGIVHQCGWLLSSRRPALTLGLEYELAGHSSIKLKFIGLAVRTFEDQNNGSLPTVQFDPRGGRLQSWQTDILVYGGILNLGGELHEDLPWNDPRNSAYFRGIVPDYLNPEIGAIRDAHGYALSHYAGNIHVLGKRGPVRPADVAGDPAQTILAGEVASQFKPWGDPTNLRDPNLGIGSSPDGFGGPSRPGAELLFLDGSVRFVRDTIDPKVLRRLSGAGGR